MISTPGFFFTPSPDVPNELPLFRSLRKTIYKRSTVSLFRRRPGSCTNPRSRYSGRAPSTRSSIDEALVVNDRYGSSIATATFISVVARACRTTVLADGNFFDLVPSTVCQRHETVFNVNRSTEEAFLPQFHVRRAESGELTRDEGDPRELWRALQFGRQ